MNQQLDLHAIIDPTFRRALAEELHAAVTSAGRAVADFARELGAAPEPFVRGLMVWNFVQNALQGLAVTRPHLGLQVERRGNMTLYRYRGLLFIAYSTRTEESSQGPIGVTAQQKKFLARLVDEHFQMTLPLADRYVRWPSEPLPAVLAYDVRAVTDDDGALTVRLEGVNIAYPTGVRPNDAIALDIGASSVTIFPTPMVIVPVEPERRIDTSTIKLRLVKPAPAAADNDQ